MFYSICFLSLFAFDATTGELVEIIPPEPAEEGEDIEVFHWTRGRYRDEQVIYSDENYLETYDTETGKYRIYLWEN